MSAHLASSTGRATSSAVPPFTGLMFVLAAMLKGYALLTIEQRAQSIWYSRRFLSIVAEAELFLGLMLILGLYRRIAVGAARIAFVIFLEVSLYLALTGMKVCPCLGRLAVHPWLMVGVDVVMLAALFYCNTRALPVRTAQTHPRTCALAGMLFLLLGLPAVLAMNRHTPEVIKSYARADARLLRTVNLALKNHPSAEDIAERVGKAAGLALSVDSDVPAGDLGDINFPNMPAWVVMEHVARAQGKTRWRKLDDGYLLEMLPWWQRLDPRQAAWAISASEVFGAFVYVLVCQSVVPRSPALPRYIATPAPP